MRGQTEPEQFANTLYVFVEIQCVLNLQCSTFRKELIRTVEDVKRTECVYTIMQLGKVNVIRDI